MPRSSARCRSLVSGVNPVSWAAILIVSASVLVTGPVASPVLAAEPAAGSPLAVADSLTAEIREHTDRYQFVAALSAATRALALRHRHLGPRHLDTADSWFRLGRLYALISDTETAERIFTIGDAARRSSLEPGDPLLAESNLDFASLRPTPDRMAEAAELHERALAELTSSGKEPGELLRRAHLSYARVLWRMGRLDDARDNLERSHRLSLDLHEESSRESAETHTWLGWLLYHQGEAVGAETHLRRALEINRNIHGADHPAVNLPSGFLADFYLHSGRLEEAAELYDRTLSKFDPDLFPLPLSLHSQNLAHGGQLNVEILLALGRDQEAWSEFERWSGWITRRMHALHNATAARDALVRARRELFDSLPRIDGTSTDPIAVGDFLSILERRSERMEEAQDAVFRDGLAGAPTLAQVQDALDPATAVVGWLSSQRFLSPRAAVWGFVIRDTGPVQWVRLAEGSAPEWWQPATSYKTQILRDASWPQRVERAPELIELAQESWRRLFAPLGIHLTGVDRLMVIPGSWFPSAELPLECLVDDDGRDLAERYCISYTPSAGTFLSARATSRETPPIASRPALFAGCPVFNDDQLSQLDESHPWVMAEILNSNLSESQIRSALDGSREALDQLPYLPYARSELQYGGELFPARRIITGVEATETGIESLRESGELGRFGVLHFATHALMADATPPTKLALAFSRVGEIPEEARATDHLITTEEIFLGWKLDADLVVLSGCQTASGPFGGTYEYHGFSLALTRAGARRVLMSRWKVDDAATALLMQRFYGNLCGVSADGTPRESMAPARALQDARLWLRDYRQEDGARPFAHPAYWAGFVLSGAAD